MIRYLAVLALSVCALSVSAKDTVVLCRNLNDYASTRAFDKAIEGLELKGYSLEVLRLSVKKSTMTYVGTGLYLGLGPKGQRVLTMGAVVGSPADKTEFFENRTYNIVSIDGVSSADMDIDEARKRVLGSGKVGTGVVLELMRYGNELGEGRAYTRYIERTLIVVPVETTCYKIELTKN